MQSSSRPIIFICFISKITYSQPQQKAHRRSESFSFVGERFKTLTCPIPLDVLFVILHFRARVSSINFVGTFQHFSLVHAAAEDGRNVDGGNGEDEERYNVAKTGKPVPRNELVELGLSEIVRRRQLVLVGQICTGAGWKIHESEGKVLQ